MSRCYFMSGSRKELLLQSTECLHSPENSMHCRVITAMMTCGCQTVVRKYGHVGGVHIRRSVPLCTKKSQFTLPMCR